MLFVNRVSIPLFIALLLSLTGCGGSSSSGGPPPIVVTSGVYSGKLTLNFTFDGETVSDTGPFNVTVAGAGQTQEVIIAFREFSGTSAIDANQAFRIPSGRFPFQIGGEGANCTAVLVFEGRFVGQAASGTAEGQVNCNPGNVVIGITGDFNVSLSQAKASLEASAPEDRWANIIASLLRSG